MSTDESSPGRLYQGPPLVRCAGALEGKDNPVTPSSSELEKVTEKGIQTTHNVTAEVENSWSSAEEDDCEEVPPLVRCVGVFLVGRDYRAASRPSSSKFESGKVGTELGVESVSWSSAKEDNCEENHRELNKFKAENGERIEFTIKGGRFFEAVKRMKKTKGYELILTLKKPHDGSQWVPGSIEDKIEYWTVDRDEDEGCDDYSSDESFNSTLTEAEKEEMSIRSFESWKRFQDRCRKAIEHEKEAEEAWEKDFLNLTYCDQLHIWDEANFL